MTSVDELASKYQATCAQLDYLYKEADRVIAGTSSKIKHQLNKITIERDNQLTAAVLALQTEEANILRTYAHERALARQTFLAAQEQLIQSVSDEISHGKIGKQSKTPSSEQTDPDSEQSMFPSTFLTVDGKVFDVGVLTTSSALVWNEAEGLISSVGEAGQNVEERIALMNMLQKKEKERSIILNNQYRQKRKFRNDVNCKEMQKTKTNSSKQKVFSGSKTSRNDDDSISMIQDPPADDSSLLDAHDPELDIENLKDTASPYSSLPPFPFSDRFPSYTGLLSTDYIHTYFPFLSAPTTRTPYSSTPTFNISEDTAPVPVPLSIFHSAENEALFATNDSAALPSHVPLDSHLSSTSMLSSFANTTSSDSASSLSVSGASLTASSLPSSSSSSSSSSTSSIHTSSASESRGGREKESRKAGIDASIHDADLSHAAANQSESASAEGASLYPSDATSTDHPPLKHRRSLSPSPSPSSSAASLSPSLSSTTLSSPPSASSATTVPPVNPPPSASAPTISAPTLRAEQSGEHHSNASAAAEAVTAAAISGSSSLVLKRRLSSGIPPVKFTLSDAQVKEDGEYIAEKGEAFRGNFGGLSAIRLLDDSSLLYMGHILWANDFITIEEQGEKGKITGVIESISQEGITVGTPDGFRHRISMKKLKAKQPNIHFAF